MLIPIMSITIPNWRFGTTNIELRIRVNKDFKPKNIAQLILVNDYKSVDCPYASGTLTVPQFSLFTTTDADIGDNVRYIIEFYNKKTNKKLDVQFPVDNFKLSPEVRIGLGGELVEVTWALIKAFDRTYNRNNIGGIALDLSEYPTRTEIQQLILSIVAGNPIGGGEGYTNAEIDSFIANLTNALNAAILTIPDIDDYYTNNQIDTIIATTISNFLNPAGNPATTTYSKSVIDILLASLLISVWRTGSGVPSNALGTDNDFYLNIDNADVYKKTNGAYAFQMNVRGLAGATGATGAAGANGTNGQGVPVGGTAGQILSKINGTNYNTEWIDAPNGSSSETIQEVDWTGLVGVTESEQATLTKSLATYAWNAGAHSVQEIASGDVRVEAKVGSLESSTMIGLSNATDAQANSSYENIDFAFFNYTDNIANCFENGISVPRIISNFRLTFGDICSVAIEGLDVIYRVNGIVIRRNTSPTINYPIRVDCAFETQVSRWIDCKIITP